MQQQLRDEFNLKLKTMRSFNLFRWLSESNLKRIALNIKPQTYAPRTGTHTYVLPTLFVQIVILFIPYVFLLCLVAVLYRAGDRVEWIHFIVSGDCDMVLDTSSLNTVIKVCIYGL